MIKQVSPRGDDAGFTLMEVLISMALGVLLISALVGAFIALTSSRSLTAARVNDASFGQELAVLLPADLQSTYPNLIDTTASTPSGCATSSGTNVVTLQWQQTLPTPTISFVASYRLLADTTPQGVAESQLVRYFCSGQTPANVAPNVRTLATGLAAIGDNPAVATVSGGVVTLVTTTLTGVKYRYVIAPRSGAAGSPGSPPPTQPPTPSPSAQPPSAVGLAMFDKDSDGWVDDVDVSLSQALGSADMASCLTSSAWALNNVPSNGTKGAPISNPARDKISIPINEGLGQPRDTSVGNFTVTFVPPSGCDMLGFSNASPADKAGPVLVSVTSANKGGGGSTAGKMEAGDSLTITFSEAIANAPTTGTVTETAAVLPTDETLTVTGLSQGPVLDGGAYVVPVASGTQPAPSFSATYTTTGSTVKATLTGSCQNPGASNDCSKLQSASGQLTFVAATSLQDAAGNSASGTVQTTLTFKLF